MKLSIALLAIGVAHANYVQSPASNIFQLKLQGDRCIGVTEKDLDLIPTACYDSDERTLWAFSADGSGQVSLTTLDYFIAFEQNQSFEQRLWSVNRLKFHDSKLVILKISPTNLRAHATYVRKSETCASYTFFHVINIKYT